MECLCGADMSLQNGKFGTYYSCNDWPACDLTRNSKGSWSDKRTRDARFMAHLSFDVLWKEGALTRSEAYAWLSREMGISPKKCHIALMNVNQCRRVIKLSNERNKDE